MIRRAPLIAAVAVASCAQATKPLPVIPTLVGDWVVVSVNGKPSRGAASITPQVYSFNFGCNRGRGNARVEGNRLVVVMPMSVTEMGCVNPDGSPASSMLNEDAGFRIVSRHSTATFYGADRVRLANEAGTIDLIRN